MDTTAAEQYVMDLLGLALSEDHAYHDWPHAQDTARHATMYARREGISGRKTDLLKTAALFHDTGFTRGHEDHEAMSVRIAREALPSLNYSTQEIDLVSRLILVTRMPQQPASLLEKIMCDADLDYLGREDFIPRGDRLRHEWQVVKGVRYTDEQWCRMRLDLLSGHSYFTASAQKQRNAGKADNLTRIRWLVQSFQNQQRTS